MTADDALSMPRDLLVALVVDLSRQVEELSKKVAATTEHVTSRDERIAALEGEKAELQLKLQQTRQALFGPSSERTSRTKPPVADTLLGIPAQTACRSPPFASL